jgi:hypothetical protein
MKLLYPQPMPAYKGKVKKNPTFFAFEEMNLYPQPILAIIGKASLCHTKKRNTKRERKGGVSLLHSSFLSKEAASATTR